MNLIITYFLFNELFLQIVTFHLKICEFREALNILKYVAEEEILTYDVSRTIRCLFVEKITTGMSSILYPALGH